MFWKKFKISHKMFLGFGIVTIIMLSVIGYSYLSFNQEDKALDLNLETYEIISNTDEILLSLLNMETGQRGYALTGKEEFLEPYYQGQLDYEKYFDLLKTSTSDNPKQLDRLMALDEVYKKWLGWGNENFIIARQKVDLGQDKIEDLITVTQKGGGKKYMDIARSIIDEVIREEERVLAERSLELNNLKIQTHWVMSLGGLIATILAMFIAILITRIVVTPVKALTNTFMGISEGDADYQFRLKVDSQDELGEMSNNFNKFMDKIEQIIIENRNESWIKTGQTQLNEELRAAENVESLTLNAIKYISKYTNAQVGAIYLASGNNILKLLGSYAYKKRKNVPNEIQVGEGLIGQAALEKETIIMTEVPNDYISISSGVGESAPRNILVSPCLYEEEVKCIIEIGSFHEFTELQLEFVERVGESLAVAIHSVEARIKMEELLSRTLEQSEKLQAQQEELRQSNEELEEQASALKESEAQLQSQQEELRVINEELEERTKSLELQKNDIILKNENLKDAQVEIEEKAKAIEVTSKYKSEFLANMSHELRTPLNSILVLSQMLGEKKANTVLTEKQLEYANTIHSSGQDLLKLINDILDLSKVEAGKMEVTLEEVNILELGESVMRSFNPIALKKGIELKVEIDEDMPKNIISDSLRLHQIINNLLSNALKFINKGEVVFSIQDPKNNKELKGSFFSEDSICISVKDTGIGIPMDKQAVIFDAFKQSDGTTSRKYGGTGLGLAISKELANLLGGEIYLVSEEEKGSKFSLVIPKDYNELNEPKKSNSNTVKDVEPVLKSKRTNIKSVSMNDDRKITSETDKSLLIIEDDQIFSNILYEIAQEKGYKALIAENGTTGMELAKKYNPDAILLDIGLPDMSGWKVIEELQKYKSTKDIPVHVISGREDEIEDENKSGIVSYINKPVSLDKLNDVFAGISEIISTSFKKLLVLDEIGEDNENILELLGGKDIEVTFLDSGKEAYDILMIEDFDCIILDLSLRDMKSIDLLQKLTDEKMLNIPVIIYTEKIPTREEQSELQKYTESIVIKGSKSSQRLIAEANLFLHNIDNKIEENKIKLIKSNQEKENSLKDKKILIVDDDMRNVFALSNLLEDKGIKIVVGRNGEEGIKKLEENPDIDLILMDIMMPVMDGYEAMREIRKGKLTKDIPIIALTAKAMKDDKQKSINAGANEYLTKPIDVEKLISLLRVWLYK